MASPPVPPIEGSTTSSGSYVWNLNTGQIIRGALRLLGAIQTGEIPPDDEYQDSLEALNALVKFWQGSGIHVWSELDCTLFLQAGEYSYDLSNLYTTGDFCCPSKAWVQTALSADLAAGATVLPLASTFGFATDNYTGVWLESGVTWWSGTLVSGSTVTLTRALPSAALSGATVVSYPSAQQIVAPLRVPAARRYQFAAPGGTPIEIPMVVMSRIDYANQPQKSITGTPTQFFFDPKIEQALFYVWPAPANNLNAIKFTAQYPLQDFTNQADTADLPQQWISTLRYNLAVELAPEYDCAPQRFEMIQGIASSKLEVSAGWDREAEPVLFGLSYDPTSRT